MVTLLCESIKMSCPEYDDYINTHVSNVIKSFNELSKKADIPEIMEQDWAQAKENCNHHDESKWDEEEYTAYANYFYPSSEDKKDQKAFDLAWLRHQHKNPHHPQHWVLLRDEGILEPLDMPIPYIIEMVCDWQSFSYVKPGSTAYKWWNDNKKNFTMTEKTKALVEKLVEFCK